MKKFAVIDLGTNTFHLLIVSPNTDGSFTELYRERKFIKLGEDGVERIGDAPYLRGLNALSDFKKVLDARAVKDVRVFGTAALRTASNGQAFVKEIKEKTDLDITLISGDEEARLIYLGVRQAVPFGSGVGMIMDIGGGSVEFIIADKAQIFWAQSFPIGVSVLRNKFHKKEPISKVEIENIEKYLDETLQPLIKNALEDYEINNLIGASGTFDVLEMMLVNEKLSDVHSEVSVADFQPLYQDFLKTTLEERLQMPNLPNDRADMIIVALVLIDYILKLAKIEKITVSAYAMKEGMLAEMS
ncbi:MAG: exopolyphosphatase/guanosine-5'-triphosphate,3'-diphosphate pyrophosphatase [Saprospiraceae bacterium]|jgi:exopolyphosphatase/guanosine-5'-triphosphate,3'-diphosphate pyrophosphatase